MSRLPTGEGHASTWGPSPAGVRGVLLDADGTLWDSTEAMHVAGAAAARAVWPELDERASREAAVHFRSDPAGHFRAFVAGEHSFDEMRLLRLRDVARAFGLMWSDDHTTTFERTYQPHFDAALAAYDDTAPLLEWLVAQGIPTRVLTNSSQEYTAAKITSAGLGALAGRVCSRDCIGVGKPDPAVYLHACAQLGFDPQDVLIVGDEWATDVWGSSEAGLRSVWLRRTEVEALAEEVPVAERLALAAERDIPIVSSLAQVPGLIRGEPTPIWVRGRGAGSIAPRFTGP